MSRNNSARPLSPDHQALTAIGLSALSAICYQIIYQQDFISAIEIAQILNKPYRSIYKIVNTLQAKGFIKHVYTGRHPYKYESVLLQDALVNYSNWQREQVKSLLTQQQRRYYEQALLRLSLARNGR